MMRNAVEFVAFVTIMTLAAWLFIVGHIQALALLAFVLGAAYAAYDVRCKIRRGSHNAP